MNAHGFTSAFAPELDAYLAFKEKMGFYGSSRIWYLKRFDAYCTAHDRAAFDRDTVEGWVTEQLARSGRYRSWMSYIRDVGRWLQVHGHSDAYVLSDRWKAQVVPAHPYLLSRYEIEAFFAAAATLNADSPWRWQAVAFFTLMHSCGLRTGETRLLRPEHVHLRDRNLDIVSSKGNRSRRLPLTGDVTEVLAGCDRVSATRFGPSRRTFFVSATGNQVTAATVGKIFNRIWDRAGLPRPAGGQQPRPYDIVGEPADQQIGQRHGQRVVRFLLHDADAPRAPVDVGQPQVDDVARAQPRRHRQQRDGCVSRADHR
jgi:site-specific recombinase XerD